MKVLKKLPVTFIVSVFLILVTAFCVSDTVFSQSSHERVLEEKYYREMESIYVREVRDLLTDKGYENSGIAMTYVLDEDGMRTYTVTIHHRRIDRLSDEEKSALLSQCGKIAFPDAACGLCFAILEG